MNYKLLPFISFYLWLNKDEHEIALTEINGYDKSPIFGISPGLPK